MPRYYNQTLLGKEIREFIDILQSIDMKNYFIAMQAIRLVHLSLSNKRDDFGLAYLLVVSAIEAVAQHAIKRDKVKPKEAAEKDWQERASKDPQFNELFQAYKEARGKNRYLTERYTEFILEYAPVSNWEDYVADPMSDIVDSLKDHWPESNFNHLLEKRPDDKYPSELEPESIKKILADSYKHRSDFIHRGQQPPHMTPESLSTRFFQPSSSVNVVKTENEEIRKILEQENLTHEEMWAQLDLLYKIESESLLLPNYDLLLGISKYSIVTWLKSQLKPGRKN